MGAGRSALRLPEGEGTVHAPLGREAEAPSLRRCAALDASWPGFVDAFVGACHAQGPAAPPPPPRGKGVPPPVAAAVRPAAERLVAIGDLHGAFATAASGAGGMRCRCSCAARGVARPVRRTRRPHLTNPFRCSLAFCSLPGDYGKTLAALRLGGLVDAEARWVGGATVAVQVGDQLDRGPDEVRILFLLERLKAEAARAGGELIVMNGNHESMNVAGRFRYSTPGGAADFARWQHWQRLGAGLKGACGLPAGACAPAGQLPAKAPPHAPEAAARAAALCPGVRSLIHFLMRRFHRPL